jgi:putative aldouronate transport system permease protein
VPRRKSRLGTGILSGEKSAGLGRKPGVTFETSAGITKISLFGLLLFGTGNPINKMCSNESDMMDVAQRNGVWFLKDIQYELPSAVEKGSGGCSFWAAKLHDMRRDRWLLLMLAPGLCIFLLFHYGPMFGLVIAFENYRPYLGFFHSPWVNFSNFIRFFHATEFFTLLRNTLLFGWYHILFVFTFPIVVALMLNEMRTVWLKRSIQTLIYIPHFLSWVVVTALTVTFFSNGGIVNNLLQPLFGFKINFLANSSTFRAEIIIQQLWKETGWGTILYLAALAGVDAQLYEAAEIDGANRWKRLWHITLPSIRGTIVVLLILGIGSFLNTGYEQILLNVTPLTQNVGDVYDTYVYNAGIVTGQLSYTTAVGLFKSVASLILITVSNRIAKRMGEDGIY